MEEFKGRGDKYTYQEKGLFFKKTQKNHVQVTFGTRGEMEFMHQIFALSLSLSFIVV